MCVCVKEGGGRGDISYPLDFDSLFFSAIPLYVAKVYNHDISVRIQVITCSKPGVTAVPIM